MDIIYLRRLGVSMGLELTAGYLLASYEKLEACVNGVGPEWFTEELREKVTDYFEYFLPSTNQHDHDFEYLPKSNRYFKIANERLYRNMKKQIKQDDNLTWFSLDKEKSRIRKYMQARFLYKMCVIYGKDAFFN